ncbi:ATP-dependent RNA helicase RhlE [Parapedobacter luteus]|uniref:DEAD-box ATP-dependent RNA helicase RhpA n=1 Tax=Parapedobacter luteus TaxID=623280 RepID=A0A1T5A1A1_9SPHI|nr:ATP-dependent RNA helicase RhlE [Parapedobacter luteus]
MSYLCDFRSINRIQREGWCCYAFNTFNTNNLQFSSFNLSEPILTALEKAGYHTPTPIQAQAIPIIMRKRDVLACAQTGTGKTASFALPLIQLLLDHRMHRAAGPQVLILAPTRELAIQIGENIDGYAALTPVKHAVIFGGVSINNQISMLRKHPEILVATPGRLLDLLNQRAVSLSSIAYLVLDEADRMLDMGFIKDIKKIIGLIPTTRQTLLFSATMPKNIEDFAQSILTNPERITVTPVSSTAEKIDQLVFPVAKADKIGLLAHLIKQEKTGYILVFSRTKHGADKIARKLNQTGITAEAIHGNKSQQARQKALSRFKTGAIKVLVATDIAARGIDVDNLHLVINYDLPNEPETYVHRIGRTGRAGASGRAWSFCDVDEREYLWQIQRLINKEIDRKDDHPFPADGMLSYIQPKPQRQVASATSAPKKRKKKRKNKPAVSAA